MKRVLVRDRVWMVQTEAKAGDDRTLLTLLDPNGGETVKVLCPPEKCEVLPEEAPSLARDSLSPLGPWITAHRIVQTVPHDGDGAFAALYSGRISPEPYQFLPVEKILQLPRPRVLIADDVGLGKTIEAGICLLEMIARGRGRRILLIVPPGLIPQWQDEMFEKFGLRFDAIENAASLDRAQTDLAEGIKPWVFLDRVVTSVEYLKKKEVFHNAFSHPWDIIVVDEAHYLAESGTPQYPYATARTRLGRKVRDASSGLILLTATPHNGYEHGFRSLLELIEPTDATFVGDKEVLNRRAQRNMIRRLKAEIFKTDTGGNKIPAFPPREPVKQIPVTDLTPDEKEIFKKVSSFCARIAQAAADTDAEELVSFAMQIIKKRMLSSRRALAETVGHRLEALRARGEQEEPPPRAEVRELQSDIPLGEAAHERIATRVVRASVPKDTRRRNSEKRQLNDIRRLLEKVQDLPDPKILALIRDLKADVLPVPTEKAIIFTEYRDTLHAIREALASEPELKNAVVELTGGLTAKQRRGRMAEFDKPHIRLMLATDAASEGLNLQAHCRRLYHFELPWNPNRMEQRNGRIDRYGQKRKPIIRYFYYPDSPEDDVLSRLVKRIAEMQADRVSTPDILGILARVRIDKTLTDINAEEDTSRAGSSLLREIEENHREYDAHVKPLLTAGKDTGNERYRCADPMIADDPDFEALILERLRDSIREGAIPHTYSLKAPHELKGPGVSDYYGAITLRCSVAIQYPARDVEFVTRLHPLAQAILDEAYKKLTASHSPTMPSRRIAVRRHPIAGKVPYAVFTYSLNDAGRTWGTLSISVKSDGSTLDDIHAKAAFDMDRAPGEVPWELVSKTFGKNFVSLQEKAAAGARKLLDDRAKAHAEKRRSLAQVLHEDAGKYRKDRLAEIEREETLAKTAEDKDGQRVMKVIMEETAVYWFKAKRAAVETFYQARLREIEEYEHRPDTSSLQPMGVLFVFPPEGKDGA